MNFSGLDQVFSSRRRRGKYVIGVVSVCVWSVGQPKQESFQKPSVRFFWTCSVSTRYFQIFSDQDFRVKLFTLIFSDFYISALCDSYQRSVYMYRHSQTHKDRDKQTPKHKKRQTHSYGPKDTERRTDRHPYTHTSTKEPKNVNFLLKRSLKHDYPHRRG